MGEKGAEMIPKKITQEQANALLDYFADQPDGNYQPHGVWIYHSDEKPRFWTLIDNREGRCEMMSCAKRYNIMKKMEAAK